jgi:hypothetical protein
VYHCKLLLRFGRAFSPYSLYVDDRNSTFGNVKIFLATFTSSHWKKNSTLHSNLTSSTIFLLTTMVVEQWSSRPQLMDQLTSHDPSVGPQIIFLLPFYRFVAQNFTQSQSIPQIGKFAIRSQTLTNTCTVIRLPIFEKFFISSNKHRCLIMYTVTCPSITTFNQMFPILRLSNLRPFSQPLIHARYINVYHSQRLAVVTAKHYKIQCFLSYSTCLFFRL